MSHASPIEVEALIQHQVTEIQRLQSDLTQSAEREAALLGKVGRLEQGGGCTLAGSGRGDCEHFVGLPGKSIPGQHDGPNDTVDCYGKPNGWCWSCWKSHQLTEAQQLAADRLVRMEQYKTALGKYGHHIEGCGHGWSCTCGYLELFREAKL